MGILGREGTPEQGTEVLIDRDLPDSGQNIFEKSVQELTEEFELRGAAATMRDLLTPKGLQNGVGSTNGTKFGH